MKFFFKYLQFFLLPVFAFAKMQVITIDRGVVTKIPIAIHQIINDAGNRKYSDEITQIMTNDLQGCGLIRKIDPRAHTQTLKKFEEQPKYFQWKSIGAHFLLVVKFTLVGGEYICELRIYDTIVGKLLDHYKISANNLRTLSHLISDKVYSRVTGEEGFFNSKVVFVKERSENRTGIAIMDIDGAKETNIISSNNIFLSPRFSPDGRKIVYFSYKQGYSRVHRRKKDIIGEVYLMDLASGERNSINIPGNKYMSYAPRFSPDGRKLVFSLSNRKGGSAIYSYDIRREHLIKLTNPIGSTIDTSPCYSPDGKKIVFNSDASGTQQLYVMNSEGTNLKRLSFGTGRYATPVWSPRGDYIAFSKITEGEFYIGVIRADGLGERMIASGYVVENPSWVSNGRMVMFTKRINRYSKYSINAVDITGHYERTVKASASDPDIINLIR